MDILVEHTGYAVNSTCTLATVLQHRRQHGNAISIAIQHMHFICAQHRKHVFDGAAHGSINVYIASVLELKAVLQICNT